MQYLLLIYGDESTEMSGADMSEAMQPWYDYTAWLQEKGWMLSGDALQSTSQATSVTTRTGASILTDGPFAETKEQLGGYYLIEVDHLDDALEAAGRCPGAAYGTIEVRPIQEMPPPPSS